MVDINDACGLSVLVHGPSKSGKSWFADTAPAPRLLLDPEGNARWLKSRKTKWNPKDPPPENDGTWDTCVVRIRDYGTLDYAFQWLAAGKHPFRSVVLDSISEAQQRCIDAISGANAMRIQDYGELLRKMSQLVRSYRDLIDHPTAPLDCVVMTAMSKQDNGGIWHPYVQGQLATSLPYFLDLICYLQAKPQEDVTAPFTNYLLTKPDVLYEAGDRSGVLPRVIQNPNLTDILQTICSNE